MIFRISNWSVGTKLTLLVLCGFALSFGVSSVHTSQTFGEETRKDLVTQAGAITAQALSTLEYVDELHAQDGIFHDESLVKEAAAAIRGAHSNEEIIARARETKVYKTLPVVAAWQIAQKRASKYGFEFRTPRLEPRNAANRADEIERKLLEELSTGDKTEAWLVDETTQRLHYMQPVRVKASCLACHGTAKDDADGDGRDMFGLAMEGEKVGDLYAGFEVICDLKEKNAQAHAASVDTMVIGGSIAVVSILVLLFSIRRLVVRPLKETVAVLDHVARGDFTQRLDLDGGDELGRMAKSLNKAVEDIAGAMVEVRNTSSALVHASAELSETTNQLSDGSQHQASALEETAASLEEITGTVKQNAESARQADQLAAASRQVAEKGGRVVADAVNAIREISKSSEQIANIITTIDGIAFQTNLLALNAAVEAARAGDQGRGFAVVASEVRSLAQRSASSAREIKTLIEESIQKVQVGSDLVDRSGKTIEEILVSVKRVTEIISEIAAASHEQATGVDQVNRAVTQMDQVVQANAGQSTELAQTAQGLAAQAEQLQELVRRFRLDAEGASSAPQPKANANRRETSAPPLPKRAPISRASSTISGAQQAAPELSHVGGQGANSDDGFIEF